MLRDFIQQTQLIYQVLGELLLGAPLTAVVFTKVIYCHVMLASQVQVSLVCASLILVQLSVCLDKVESLLIETAFRVPALRQVICILKHQLWILLISMDEAAHTHKLLVVVALGKGNPAAGQITVIVLSVTTHIQGRVTGMVVILEVGEVNLTELVIITLNLNTIIEIVRTSAPQADLRRET